MLRILLRLFRHVQGLMARVPFLGKVVIPGTENALLGLAGNNPMTWPFLFRMYWQFHLERVLHKKGAGRVSDPLFAASLERMDERPRSPNGRYQVRIMAEGLLLYGSVKDSKRARISLTVNGTTVRKTTTTGNREVRIRILRSALFQFPPESQVILRTEDGTPLSYKGRSGFVLKVPTGSGRIINLAASGHLISKKGGISQTPERIRARQDAYLEIYSEARKFFEAEFGKSLFLLYGTLLGVYRGGDFIPGDDDFDGGYVTDETDPAKIKEETKGMIVKLVQAGFTVSFNRRGKLFRLQKASGATDGMHLDLRPIWFDKDHMIAHKCAYIPAVRADFLPVRTTNLRGVEVDLPANPEAMLAGYYGPGWKVPDPSYVNDVSRVPSSIQRQLNQVYISPREYLEMTDYLRSPEGFRPGIGRFVSDGLQNLYPLEDFIEEEV